SRDWSSDVCSSDLSLCLEDISRTCTWSGRNRSIPERRTDWSDALFHHAQRRLAGGRPRLRRRTIAAVLLAEEHALAVFLRINGQHRAGGDDHRHGDPPKTGLELDLFIAHHQP